MPLAPEADRADVEEVHIGVIVVALAEGANRAEMGLLEHDVVHVRDPLGDVAPVLELKARAPLLLEPLGDVHVLPIRADTHDSEGEPLAGLTGALQHPIEHLEVDTAFFGLDLAPVEAEVGRRTRQPVQRRVLIGEAVEGLPAHAWVGEQLVGLRGANGNGLSVGRHADTPKQQRGCQEPHSGTFL